MLCAENNLPLVSYVLTTYNRKEELKIALMSIVEQSYKDIEIVVVDNNSSDGTKELFDKCFIGKRINYIRLNYNAGAAGGRNIGIKNTKGSITVLIDDDAEIIDRNLTNKVVNKFASDKEIGILAFKIIDNTTRKVENIYFPSDNKKLDRNKEFETAWFIGAGCSFRKKIFYDIGLFGDYYPYSGEEVDLSWRLMESSYKIIYYPEAEVIHYRDLEKQKTSRKYNLPQLELTNRLKLVIRHLPWRYVVTHIMIWSLWMLLREKGNIFVVVNAYTQILKDRKKLLRERKVLSKKALQRIKNLKMDLIY